jgi:hypothetical protein
MELHDHTFFYHRDANPQHMHTNDFVMDYAMGKLAMASPHEKIYDEKVQSRYWHEALRSEAADSTGDVGLSFYCPNPPQFILWCMPFSLLTMSQAYVIRIVLTVLLGLGGVIYLSSARGNWPPMVAATATWLTLCSLAGCQSLHMSVSGGWLMLAFICVYFGALLQGRDILAGVALCLAAYKVQYAPFLLVPALAMKKWKIVLSAGLCELALLIVSGFVLGFDNILDFPRGLLSGEQSNGVTSVNPQVMIDLRGLLSPYVSQHFLIPLCIAAIIPALICTGYACRKAYLSGNKQSFAFSLALLLLAAVCFGPHNHMPDCLFFISIVALTVPALNSPEFKHVSLQRRAWNFAWLFYPALMWLIFLSVPERPACMTLLVVNLLMLVLSAMCYRQAAANKASKGAASDAPSA